MRIFLFFIFCLSSVFLIAQEEVKESENLIEFSEESKIYVLIVFGIATLILVLRTFRNKPSA